MSAGVKAILESASPIGQRARGRGCASRIGLRAVVLLAAATAFALGPTSEARPSTGEAHSRPLALGPTREALPSTGEAQYWCPMHPDQRSDARGKCGICGMALVRMPPAVFQTYPVDLRVTPTLAGARLRLAVSRPTTPRQGSGQAPVVRKFSIVHERPMHLFIVGDGLEYFAHEHPALQRDGVFMLDVRLPRPGPYMAIAEFLPDGGTPQTFQQMFTTGEAFGRAASPAIDLAPRTVDGVRVSLDATGIKAGETTALTFRIDDAASGAPVTDLEPYLGASAHLLIVPVDLTEALHGHPTEDGRGPGIAFAPLVPRAGRYKVWIQFQRGGKVSTAAFVIEVP